MISFPFCVILTHRHGAAIGICNSDFPSFLKMNFSETCTDYVKQMLEQKQEVVVQNHIFEFLSDSQTFVLVRVLGKTAENLTNLFQFACRKLDLDVSQIKHFIVGTGPGSFTGLRLGCAFVNGLHFASSARLFSIQTLLWNELMDKVIKNLDSSEIKLQQGGQSAVYIPQSGTQAISNAAAALFQMNLEQELGAYQPHDHSSGFVTFFDLLHALHEIRNKNIIEQLKLVPHYNQEPSPVKNLLQHSRKE